MKIPGAFRDRRDGPEQHTELLGLSDPELVDCLLAGNNDAFAVVFLRYHRLVHVTALRILRDAAEAEDVTQSVFLEIYRKLGQFDPERGTLKVWLLQFAYSRSLSRFNSLESRRRVTDTPADGVEEVSDFWRSKRPPSQEAARLTEEILCKLPDAQRTTIEMVFFDGHTLKEIAIRRQESFSNVRHHYYRGLQRLRVILEERPGSGDETQRSILFNEVRRAES